MHTTKDEVVTSVGQHMAWAAHKRDHAHRTQTETCHPHAVEVVHLGVRAVTVCHDCAADTGLVPERVAEHLAQTHRRFTVSEDVPLLVHAVA